MKISDQCLDLQDIQYDISDNNVYNEQNGLRNMQVREKDHQDLRQKDDVCVLPLPVD